MNMYDLDLLKILSSGKNNNQRELSEKTGYSLGKTNESYRKLVENNWIESDGTLTKIGERIIGQNTPKNAVILAAGFGMRMVPINNEIPKGLLEVHGEILIERLIRQLQEKGIKDITIVVGFLKEKFEYLIDEFNVKLVYNKNYSVKNNLSSLALVEDKINNTYILPSDIWLEKNPFDTREVYPWYLVSDELDEVSTVRVNRKNELVQLKHSLSGNKMIGVTYLEHSTSKVFREKLSEYSLNPKYDDIFWEEILFNNPELFKIYAKVFSNKDVTEIDTYEQLRNLDVHSSHLNTEIIDLIAEQLSVKTSEIININLLKKGMTNRSFIFEVQNKRYIMRIPGEGTDELIDRRQEAAIYETLMGEKISDDIIYISPEKGYKITKFLENSRVCNLDDMADVARCMNQLRSFHEKEFKVSHQFNLLEKIEFYESLWEGKSSIFKDYYETKKKIQELNKLIDNLPKKMVLTHIDAVPDNFLFTENGEVRLIDWEYAGMQDPHLDIAMFAIYSLYERKQVDQLIDLYFLDGCSDEIRMKIYCYIAISGLLWSNWCEFKRFCGVEFGEYSLRQYRYAKEYYQIVKNNYLKESI